MRRTVSLVRCALALAAALALPLAAMAAEGPWLIHPAQNPVKLDGRLDDWSIPSGALGSLTWDQEALYLAVDAPDAHPTFADDTSRDFAGSDRVVLLVSTAPEASAERSDKLGERDYAFVFTPDSRYRRPLKTVYGFGGHEHVELDLRQVTVAARVTASRYQLEARIPWSLLGVTPAPGQTLRVAVLRFDATAGGPGRATDLWGRPVPGPVGRSLMSPVSLGSA
ncbi:MAG: hypothetical protein ACM3RP_13620 [Chitinophagales bacterium]